MNIKLLESFYYVVTEGSFVKASLRLNVSQPAISSSIKKIEAELGFALLERSNRGVILTPRGNEVFESCKLVFSELESLENRLGISEDTISAPLKIGTSDEIASYLLAKKFKVLKEEFPMVQPEVYMSGAAELLEELKEGKLDLLILFYTPKLPEGVSEQLLYDVRFKGVVKKEFKNHKSVLKNVIGDNIIYPSHKKKFASVKKHLQKYKDTRVGLSTNNVNMHLQLVLQGEGIAFLPEFMVDPLINSGKISCLSPSVKDFYGLKIVMRNTFIPNKAYKKLINIISH